MTRILPARVQDERRQILRKPHQLALPAGTCGFLRELLKADQSLTILAKHYLKET